MVIDALGHLGPGSGTGPVPPARPDCGRNPVSRNAPASRSATAHRVATASSRLPSIQPVSNQTLATSASAAEGTTDGQLVVHAKLYDVDRASLPADSMGNWWNGSYVTNTGNLKLDLVHNFFL